MNHYRIPAYVIFVGSLLFASLATAATNPPADLVVYGATASGVMTAYSAAREGLNVVLLSLERTWVVWSPAASPPQTQATSQLLAVMPVTFT